MDGELVELWGFRTGDVDAVKEMLEHTLRVEMVLHESESIGPYYFAELCDGHAELTLRPNLDPAYEEDPDDPDALAEPDFPDFGTLLYVDWRTTAHDCRRRVEGLALAAGPGGEAQLLLVE